MEEVFLGKFLIFGNRCDRYVFCFVNFIGVVFIVRFYFGREDGYRVR